MKKEKARRNNRLIFNALRRYFSERKIIVVFVLVCYVGLLAIGIANASDSKLERAKKLDSSISLELLQELDKPKPNIYIIQELQGGGIIFKACSVREVVMLARNYCKDLKACEKAVLITAEQGDNELAPCLDKQSAYKNYIKLQGAN